ncbi:MAG TPA: formylglycine-generating enzyme family protein [Polyangiaceae bacterium]
MTIHRISESRTPARAQASVARWLLLLLTGCSFKSLDYMQGGERPGDEAAGGTTAGGPHESGSSGTTHLATLTLISAGHAGMVNLSGSTSMPGSNGGASATYEVRGTAGSGGTTVDVTESAAHGGVAQNGGQSSSGGSRASSSDAAGAPVHAGGEGTPPVTLAGSAGTSSTSFGGAAAGNQSAGTSSSEIPAAGRAGMNYGGAAGASGSTTNSSMVYGAPGQSCGNGLSCPGGSCCDQIAVPTGTFSMGTNSDASRNPDESPPHATTLDAFKMDKFEVTVGRFRSFVAAFDGTMPPAAAGAHPKIPNSGWQVAYDANLPTSKSGLQSAINCSKGQYQTFTELAGVREAMPMNCVSWYVAFAFCIWDGGRLPTEAEWEMAASNGSNETRFPWGQIDPDPKKHAVMNCLGDEVAGCSPSDLLPVGSRVEGANLLGHVDLAGSLWEWTLDYYDGTYYQAVGTCGNCASLSAPTPRVIRGGNFTSTLVSLRATGRASKPPNVADPYAGFRCVRSL